VRSAGGAMTANAVFDESGNFLLYGSMLGIKGASCGGAGETQC